LRNQGVSYEEWLKARLELLAAEGNSRAKSIAECEGVSSHRDAADGFHEQARWWHLNNVLGAADRRRSGERGGFGVARWRGAKLA
jgi:hypothetical protein